MDGTNIVGLLNELEAEKLIERRRSPEDRRRHVVELTATGAQILAKAEFALAAAEDEVLAALDEAQRETLYRLLQLASTGMNCAGLVRGAYHFAQPASSSGAAQADYFAAHGGGWSRDNQTLPGMLDIEYNPNGATCYGLSQASMRSWITSFLNEYHAKTGRWATIYTTTDWWTTCTGNSSAYGSNDPLAIARYSNSVGTLPAGWGFYTIWQWADSGTFPGDQDVFNGSHDRLVALANNTP